MRLKISFSKTNLPIPKCNQHYINSFIHKKLGNNNIYHDSPSDYNISTLLGGRTENNSREVEYYRDGAYFYISSQDDVFLNNIVSKLEEGDVLCEGLVFEEYSLIEPETFYNGENNIRFLSPLVLKTSKNRIDKYHFYTEPDFLDILKETTIKRLVAYDNSLNNILKLNLNNFDISIADSPKNKTVKVDYKIIDNKKIFVLGNMCNLNITTNKKVMEVLYNIGLGKSTGSGFGTFIFRKNVNL